MIERTSSNRMELDLMATFNCCSDSEEDKDGVAAKLNTSDGTPNTVDVMVDKQLR